MTGAHRGTTQTPLESARKSAVWLLVLAGVLLVPLAVVGAFVHLAFADLTVAYLVLIGLQFALCVKFAIGIVRILRRGRSRSPADVDELLHNVFSLTVFTAALLLSIGHLWGWDHGVFGYAVIGVGGLILMALSAYFLGGKRRLMAALDGRAAKRNGAG